MDLGDAGDTGALGHGLVEGRGLTAPQRPQGDQRAVSLRPPPGLGPRTRPPKSPQHGLDMRAPSAQGPQAREEVAVPFLGIGFSSLDMSLCVVLYVASSLFLMLMYFFFRARSKRWKVRLYHPAV